MLTRAFFHVAQHSPEIGRWLTFGFCADSVTVSGADDEEIRFVAYKGGNRKDVVWTAASLLERLRQSTSTNVNYIAWLLLCFHDVYYDTDSLLHDYVSNACGVRLEWVPFYCDGANLAAECDRTGCTGKPKKTDKVIFEVDKDKVRVLLPLSSADLKVLLFERLRRISL